MCRILAYLGEPLSLDGPLFAAENSLVGQSVSPRLMSLLNIGGFGLVAWEAASREPERPYTYRTPDVPVFDRNLKALAEKVHVTSAIAHVRGVTYDAGQSVGPQNLHPFRFGEARVVLAQNGALHRFAEMRYDLLEFIRPELAHSIEGTTDAEWIYAAVLSRLDDPFGAVRSRELADATEATVTTIGELRERHGIHTHSPVNLVLGDGNTLIAVRFCFDYGWYRADQSFFDVEREFDFTSLWFALGKSFAPAQDGWDIRFDQGTGAAFIASEPLGRDTTGWLEVPEYSMAVLTSEDAGVTVEVRELAG
jgi:glutamine amidotransferase